MYSSEKENMSDIRKYSNEWWVALYLQYGSVEEVLKKNPDLPISVADFHRKIKQYGIVKSIGRRNTSLIEVLQFFAEKALDPSVPIEKLYKTMSLTFQEAISVSTIHRVYDQILKKGARTSATAVILSLPSNPEYILVADELKDNRRVGKVKGRSSVLMGFSDKLEPHNHSVLRVLQQEFSIPLTLKRKLTIGGELANVMAPKAIKPFMYLHLLDIELGVYHITLPDTLGDISSVCQSHKVDNHRFVHISEILESDNTFRHGVMEIIRGYVDYLRETRTLPIIQSSHLNQKLSLAYQKD